MAKKLHRIGYDRNFRFVAKTKEDVMRNFNLFVFSFCSVLIWYLIILSMFLTHAVTEAQCAGFQYPF